ncbi:MAG: toll/interleukin-1 receptor domain-containing protein [Haloplanus sp.]
MGSVFVEPLQERDRVGEVFVSHVTEDKGRIRETLLDEFVREGVPYFLSDEDIEPGQNWLDRLEQATSRASCGVVVLTENSLNSQWVWYEAGILEGMGKPIYPFVLDDIEMERVPEFVSRKQVSRDVSALLGTLEEEVREFGEIAEATALDPQRLRRVTITMTIDTAEYPASLVESLSFGYQLIGFDKPSQASSTDVDRVELLLMPIDADSVVRESDAVKVEYSVPLHETYGVEFKPYVHVENTADVDAVLSMLREDVFRDASQSASGERQRVYFLLPIDLGEDEPPEESGNVVPDGDGNLNNWLYPQ